MTIKLYIIQIFNFANHIRIVICINNTKHCKAEYLI